MKSNWIEIKRFLNDYKKFVFIGSSIISLLFFLVLYSSDMTNEKSTKTEDENLALLSGKALNDAQPAYFKLYIEDKRGIAYKNSLIINQYFNLDSVKEKIKEEIGIDIKKVEKKIPLNQLENEIKVINISRDEKSYLFTASFNLGSERKNLIIAEYYYNLLNSEAFPILKDKETYVFEEPKIFENTEEDSITEEVDGERNNLKSDTFLVSSINHLKKLVIGFIFGLIFTMSLALFKVIFGKRLDYYFTYIQEDDVFIVADKNLENKDFIRQIVTYPFTDNKIILSEKKIDAYTKDILIDNNKITFDENEKNKILMINIQTISELEIDTTISEIIVIVYSKFTTRKWYEKQREFAEINKIPLKIIQINY